jgi:hypothetical protein
MQSKHWKTLEAIFTDPVRSNVPWADIEVFFAAVGALVTEGRGSSVSLGSG